MFIWIFVILGVYYFYTHRDDVRTIKHSHDDDALELLKLKYVKGEIDEETYLKMKSNL